jgi:hypothetical protein
MAAAPEASPREAGKAAFHRGDYSAAVRARAGAAKKALQRPESNTGLVSRESC